MSRCEGSHTEAEALRQSRLVDQALTMQARLRDRDERVGTGLLSLTVLSSVVGVAFAFASDDIAVTVLGITGGRPTWLGWLAVVSAGLTSVELVLDRRGAAQRRRDAVGLLSSLKSEYRTMLEVGVDSTEARRLSEKYSLVMATVPAVPERVFNRLKAAHLLKVEISRELSRSPGLSYMAARRAVRARGRGGSNG